MKKINIAIDGPVASGKSSVSLLLAKKLGYVFIDTGLLYRAFTYWCLFNKVDFNNEKSIINQLDEFNCLINDKKVLLNGKNISDHLKDPDVIASINYVTIIEAVREKLVKLQQDAVKDNGYIIAGRDIATIVLPDAQLKIYLTASIESRVKRRYQQRIEQHQKIDLEEIEKLIRYRDQIDMNRKYGPLKIAKDAVVIDNSDQSTEQTINLILDIVDKIINNKELI